jgi:hypothetical protein
MKCPRTTTKEIEKMTPLEAMILARDIHLWYRDHHRRAKKLIEWERVWVDMYERVIAELKKVQG